jgi:prevent-host-death family protein
MWQAAEARKKFSALLTRAEAEGPQRVSRRGRTFVVLSEREYERLTGQLPKHTPKMSLGEYLLQAPSLEGVDLERDRSPGREVDLG